MNSVSKWPMPEIFITTGPVIALVAATGSLEWPIRVSIPPNLANELDLGEASVIQAAVQQGVGTVAIDEKAGRRIARLYGLRVTGSLGILVKAKQQGLIQDLAQCLMKMKSEGIWISDELACQAMRTADKP